MGLIDFPDVVGMFEGAKNAGLEREVANAFVSAACSGYLTFLWETGKRKWLGSEGQALQRMAVATHLTLEKLLQKNFLTLTVPKDMLDPNLRSQFQSEAKT